MGNAYRSVLALKPTGDAVPANVLAGKTFSNAAGVGKTGTMVNNGAVSITLTDQDPTYTIPEGYHNGLGVVGFTSSGGDGADLVVTCDSAFAGATITCTDGTTTYTETCPSSSPYIVTFKSIPTGTWTVSAEISGVTYSESVLIQNFDAELKSNININVDFYSAANDTVSYIGAVDGQTHTIVTDSTGHANAQITIQSTGSSITFTSSVAKDPNNLSNAYEKSITLYSNTTDVYVMPDLCAYWYGWNSSNIIAVNGYDSKYSNFSSKHKAPTLTKNTNNFYCTLGNNYEGEGYVLTNYSLTGLNGKVAKAIKTNGSSGQYKEVNVVGAYLLSGNAYKTYRGNATTPETIAVDSAMIGIKLHSGLADGNVNTTVNALWAE